MTVSDPISKQILWLALNSSRVFSTKFCPRDTCLQEMIFALASWFSMIPLGIEFFIFTIRNSFSFLSKHLHHRGNSVPLQLEGRRALEHTILFVLLGDMRAYFSFLLSSQAFTVIGLVTKQYGDLSFSNPSRVFITCWIEIT